MVGRSQNLASVAQIDRLGISQCLSDTTFAPRLLLVSIAVLRARPESVEQLALT